MKALSLILLCSLILVARSSQAVDLASGMSAYVKGDYASALATLQLVARNGDADAQYLLGRMYTDGNGVLPDKQIAYQWYSEAAAQGQRLAIVMRRLLAQELSPEQIAQAEQRLRETRSAPSANDTTTTPRKRQASITFADGREENKAIAINPDGRLAGGEISETAIARVQLNLKRLGYSIGPINGQYNAQTQAAIRAYQSEHQLLVDGKPSESLLQHMTRNDGPAPGISRQQPGSSISREPPVIESSDTDTTWKRLL